MSTRRFLIEYYKYKAEIFQTIRRITANKLKTTLGHRRGVEGTIDL